MRSLNQSESLEKQRKKRTEKQGAEPAHLQIHHQAQNRADQYRRAEWELIEAIQQVEKERVFVHLGYGSLWKYAVDGLGLSEAVTSNLIVVSRKAREIPALGEAIRRQEVSVSVARKLTPILTPENQQRWLGLARASTTRQIEKAIAREHPRAARPTRVRYLDGQTVELSVSLPEQVMLQLREVEDWESQRRGRTVDTAEALAYLIEQYHQRHSPQQRARRQVARHGRGVRPDAPTYRRGVERRQQNQQSRQQPKQREDISPHATPFSVTDASRQLATPADTHEATKTLSILAQRTPIPRAHLHQVHLRDQGQCAFVEPSGRRYGSRRFIHIHHIQFLAKGGSHDPENLITLCATHHRHVHEREGLTDFGIVYGSVAGPSMGSRSG